MAECYPLYIGEDGMIHQFKPVPSTPSTDQTQTSGTTTEEPIQLTSDQ